MTSFMTVDPSSLPASLILVGCGKMGGAMLEGWLRMGLKGDRITIVDPHAALHLVSICEQHGIALNPSPDTIRPPEVLVLGIKPQMLDDAASSLRAMVGPATLVVSILAGKTHRRPAQPACPALGAIVRAMPNLPASVQRGVTGAAASRRDDARPARQLAHTLLSGVGRVEWVDGEHLIDAVTAVSGLRPRLCLLSHRVPGAGGGGRRIAAGSRRTPGPRDRGRRGRAAAPLRPGARHAARERDVARRNDGRGAGGADGARGHGPADPRCGRSRPAAARKNCPAERACALASVELFRVQPYLWETFRIEGVFHGQEVRAQARSRQGVREQGTRQARRRDARNSQLRLSRSRPAAPDRARAIASSTRSWNSPPNAPGTISRSATSPMRAGVSLSEFRDLFPSKGAILAALLQAHRQDRARGHDRRPGGRARPRAAVRRDHAQARRDVALQGGAEADRPRRAHGSADDGRAQPDGS